MTTPDIAAEVAALPGLKEKELRESATCSLCTRPIARYGPIFYRVRIEQIALNVSAIHRRDGLSAFLGSPVLARVMGPDEDLAKVMDSATLSICLECLGSADLGRMIEASR
jgi:hypothetical protein